MLVDYSSAAFPHPEALTTAQSSITATMKTFSASHALFSIKNTRRRVLPKSDVDAFFSVREFNLRKAPHPLLSLNAKVFFNNAIHESERNVFSVLLFLNSQGRAEQ